jgi:hypothetical protein
VRRVGCAAALIALILSAAGARAAAPFQIETDPQSGIAIDVEPVFNPVAPNGCMPVRVRIKNGSRSEGRWNLVFQSPAGYRPGRSQNVVSRFAARVGAGSEREFEYLIPMQTSADGGYGSLLGVDCSGPGVRNGSHAFPSPSRSGGRSIGATGFGEKLIAGRQEKLSAALKAKGLDERFSVVEFTKLPPDWRALSAFDQLWILDAEWDALPAGVRLAIGQWVSTGGRLVRCSQGAAADPVDGSGAVASFTTAADGSLDLEKVVKTMERPGPNLRESLLFYTRDWPDKAWIPPYSASAPLLVLVIIVFGTIVGPVNLYLFAGKEKRARIFWTTPLISVVGTVVIGLTIFVQDGFGGWGKRIAVVVLDPGRHSEALVQVQASKTGVLTSSDFRLDPGAMIRQLPTTKRSLNCSVSGDGYAGDWFQSRSVQGQAITAVRPTRAEIRLLNAGEVAEGKPPRILSQIDAQLDRVYLRTAGDRVFCAEDVGPGREVAMQPDNAKGAADMLAKEIFQAAGPLVKIPPAGPRLEKEIFYALSKNASGAMVSTLPSIRWADDRALFLCPATP